jgi:FlaA1/EpsC-like NDP-sugar epimerase
MLPLLIYVGDLLDGSKATLIKYRRLPIVALHLGLIVVSNYFAFWLKFDGNIHAWNWHHFLRHACLAHCNTRRHVHAVSVIRSLWRYTKHPRVAQHHRRGHHQQLQFLRGCPHLLSVKSITPRSIFIIDSLVLIFFMGGVRLSRRLPSMAFHFKGDRRVLIYGAGDAAEMIVRDMRNNRARYEPIGFIDDNQAKIGQHIHGVPVLGSRADIQKSSGQRIPMKSCWRFPARRALRCARF